MAFLAEDEDAFAAVLSFVDDFSADGSSIEAAAVDVAPVGEQLEGDELDLPLIEDIQLQVDAEADPIAAAATQSNPPLRRSSRLLSKAKSNGDSLVSVESDPEVLRSSRRAAANAKKKMLRKAGVYGNPNRIRNERRLEVVYLHEKVDQLETKLHALQERSSPAATMPTELATSTRGNEQLNGSQARRISTDEDLSEKQLSDPSTWEDCAARERSQREESERENIRLKLILASQIKVAKGLESILLKRAQQQIAECSASIQRSVDVTCPSGRTLDFRADASDFQELLEYLNATYREVDSVLASNGLAWMETTQQDVEMREGVGGLYLEVFSNKVMPFGLHATAEATWNYFKGSKKHRGTLYAKAAQNLDTPYTIIEHFSKELVAGNSSTDVRIKQIVRRYVEADREVVVWVASIEPVDMAQKPFGGFKSRHRNYAVIKRARTSTPQHELSLLQLVSHGMLDTQAGTIYDPKYVRALTDFLLNDAARNIKSDQQLIENVLMDQMLRP